MVVYLLLGDDEERKARMLEKLRKSRATEAYDAAETNPEIIVSAFNFYSLFGDGFFFPCLSRPARSPAGLEAFGRGKNMPMAQEADFYSAEEAAKVLGIPVRRVFGMLCSGELEGHQDEWARWHVPASAVQGARQSPKPFSDPGELPEENAESRPAPEDETRALDAATTTVLANGGPLWEPPVGAYSPSGEETTQEEGEALVGGSPASRTYAEGSDAETTAERPPLGQHRETAASDAAIQGLVEQLVAAAAKTRELQDRLELAKATEAALRESLEREHQRADRESAQAERQRMAAAEQLEEEPAAGRGEGFWRGLFRG